MVQSVRPRPLPSPGMQRYTADGARKYLTAGERDAFLREVELADRQTVRCGPCVHGPGRRGCRLSEALIVDRVDRAAGVLVIESA
jgi:integrase/recombinase XerD